MKLRKGDHVRVIAGKDVGKEGEITRVIPETDRVIVDGVNVAKRHQRATKATMQGGIIDKDMPMHVSNVAIVCAPAAADAHRLPLRRRRPRSASAASAGRTCDGDRDGEQPRLKTRYETELRPALQEELGLGNVMQVPRLREDRPQLRRRPGHPAAVAARRCRRPTST